MSSRTPDGNKCRGTFGVSRGFCIGIAFYNLYMCLRLSRSSFAMRWHRDRLHLKLWMSFDWENTGLQRPRELLIFFFFLFCSETTLAVFFRAFFLLFKPHSRALKVPDKVQKWFGEVHHDGRLRTYWRKTSWHKDKRQLRWVTPKWCKCRI